MNQTLSMNGVRIPFPGETVYVVAPILKKDRRGKVFASRKPTEVELVEAKVHTSTIQPVYEDTRSGKGWVSYTGKAFPVDLTHPWQELNLSPGNFSWLKDDAERMLETFQKRGMVLWYDGRIQYADTKEFVGFVPLAAIAEEGGVE